VLGASQPIPPSHTWGQGSTYPLGLGGWDSPPPYRGRTPPPPPAHSFQRHAAQRGARRATCVRARVYVSVRMGDFSVFE